MRKYQETYRRTLLDMHVPDWDPSFLSLYEPADLAERYANSNIEGILIYCKSHLGLNYWPAPVGGIHPAARGRDLVGEMVDACRHRGLAPAAYHSVIFDNWAAETHPEWRQVAHATRNGGANVGVLGDRYGVMCPSNPDYLAYEIQQVTALVSRYEVDALWIDMVFWCTVCVCAHCERKSKEELGFGIPDVIDWADENWARFQEARTRWLEEFYVALRDAAREAKPDIAIAHNLAPELFGWTVAASTDQIPGDSFAAGDLYGGRDEQLFVSKLMQALTANPPAEYMTSRAPDLTVHTQLRSERELLLHALGAVTHHLAFLFIDAIDPVGTTSAPVYDRIKNVFDVTSRYEHNLGGEPVEDVALYYSARSQIRWQSNGTPVVERFRGEERDYDKALLGACATLQEHHIGFGIVTPATLQSLDNYRVLLLPNVTRMSTAEIVAIREFVRRGGRVYASGNTSLGDIDGHRSSDFELADLFGVHAAGRYEGGVAFVRPEGDLIAAAVSPEPYVSFASLESADGNGVLDIPLLGELDEDTTVLGSLTLPYAYPSRGTMEGHDFASIHASPPWTDTGKPAVVEHVVDGARVIYSAVPLEAAPDVTGRTVFAELIRGLIGDGRRLEVSGPAQVWATLVDQVDRSRMVASFLNYDRDHQTGLTASVSVTVAPPLGQRILTSSLGESVASCAIATDGKRADLSLRLDLFEQIVFELADDEGN